MFYLNCILLMFEKTLAFKVFVTAIKCGDDLSSDEMQQNSKYTIFMHHSLRFPFQFVFFFCALQSDLQVQHHSSHRGHPQTTWTDEGEGGQQGGGGVAKRPIFTQLCINKNSVCKRVVTKRSGGMSFQTFKVGF